MKEKIKKFVKEYQTELIIAGLGIATFSYGAFCQRAWTSNRSYVIRKKKYGPGMDAFLNTYLKTGVMYGHILEEGDGMKFAELCKLAKTAVDFDPTHLNDKILGLFVVTKP